jgi:hypothetical protein
MEMAEGAMQAAVKADCKAAVDAAPASTFASASPK